MQTPIFGISCSRAASANVQVLCYPPCDSAAAFYCLEAPVVTPFAKSSARVKSYPFHPRVNSSQARISIEIEDNVSVGNIDLVLQDYPVGFPQNPCESERIDGSPDKPIFVKRLPPRICNLTRDRTTIPWSVIRS